MVLRYQDLRAIPLDIPRESRYTGPMSHEQAIREQITRDVTTLVAQAHRRVAELDEARWEHVTLSSLDHVELGYLTNLHKGRAVFGPGETIANLPIKVNGPSQGLHSITLAYTVTTPDGSSARIESIRL